MDGAGHRHVEHADALLLRLIGFARLGFEVLRVAVRVQVHRSRAVRHVLGGVDDGLVFLPPLLRHPPLIGEQNDRILQALGGVHGAQNHGVRVRLDRLHLRLVAVVRTGHLRAQPGGEPGGGQAGALLQCVQALSEVAQVRRGSLAEPPTHEPRQGVVLAGHALEDRHEPGSGGALGPPDDALAELRPSELLGVLSLNGDGQLGHGPANEGGERQKARRRLRGGCGQGIEKPKQPRRRGRLEHTRVVPGPGRDADARQGVPNEIELRVGRTQDRDVPRLDALALDLCLRVLDETPHVACDDSRQIEIAPRPEFKRRAEPAAAVRLGRLDPGIADPRVPEGVCRA